MVYEYIILGILLLSIYLSILDIKYRKVSNWPILFIFVVGFIYRIYLGNIYFMIGVLFYTILGYILWNFNFFGGADAKLLMSYSTVLPYNGFPNMYAVMLFFLVIWALLYCAYAVIYKLSVKRKLNAKDNRMPGFPVFPIALAIVYAMHIS